MTHDLFLKKIPASCNNHILILFSNVLNCDLKVVWSLLDFLKVMIDKFVWKCKYACFVNTVLEFLHKVKHTTPTLLN